VPPYYAEQIEEGLSSGPDLVKTGENNDQQATIVYYPAENKQLESAFPVLVHIKKLMNDAPLRLEFDTTAVSR